MNNVHVHLHVTNLEASRSFYERFLGVPPVKVKPGYVKFLPNLAPINLALSAGEARPGTAVSHLGFQVDSREAVRDLLDRVKASGLTVREEMDTNCCYANQDKFWVRDPDGTEWEVYHLNHDLDEDAPAATSTCCAPLARIGKRV
ncbi:MAG TPA: ArsI/CadI family heavy metal resistance metalloenzyme [Vicinamibacterales bacterium]